MISWAKKRLQQEVAYAKHGTPEMLAGGEIDPDFRYHQHHIALSKVFIADLREKYPAAWRDVQGFTPAGFSINHQFQKLASKTFAWADYGPDRQRKIEEEFTAAIRSLHEAAEEAERTRAVRQAELDERRGFSWANSEWGERQICISRERLQELCQRHHVDPGQIQRLAENASRKFKPEIMANPIEITLNLHAAVRWVLDQLAIGMVREVAA